jgi:hypothetical protein
MFKAETNLNVSKLCEKLVLSYVKGKAVPLHAMEALGGEEV